MSHARKLPMIAIALTLAAPPALAETMMFQAALTGKSEVPPSGSSASGNAMVALDTEGKIIAWKISYDGLTGSPSAAHFHGPAAPGSNADPAIDISGMILEGVAPISDQQIADLQAGKWYLNVHTAKFPDGEIRGQLEPAKM